MKNKLSVTIGIPAYNEEENIGNLLVSLLNQKENKIRIKYITVVSDGSTDNTVKIVHSFRDKRIRCLIGHTRQGKPSRLNQLFAQLDTDVLVVIDADMICKNDLTIENLVVKFLQGENIGLVSGNSQPLPIRPQSLVEEAVNNYYWARKESAKYFGFGKTGYSVHGFLAYSKEFLKDFHIPHDVLNDDAYSYFTCLTSNFKHLYSKNSIVYMRSPITVGDYVKQMTRYVDGGIQLWNYFDKEMVVDAIKLPVEINLRIMTYQLFRNPFAYIFLKILTITSVFYSNVKKHTYNSKWAPVRTSKKFAWKNQL